MAIDKAQLKRNYATFQDFKIEQIARNKAGELDPEVIPILIEEIERRGLDADLIKEIKAQTSVLTQKEFEELKSRIIQLPCPICHQKKLPLMGTWIRVVKSFIFFTNYSERPLIACEACVNEERKNALISTAILGWWGIPWGLFRTIRVIITSWTDNKKREEQSDAILRWFIRQHKGTISANRDKEEDLVDLIAHVNGRNN